MQFLFLIRPHTACKVTALPPRRAWPRRACSAVCRICGLRCRPVVRPRLSSALPVVGGTPCTCEGSGSSAARAAFRSFCLPACVGYAIISTSSAPSLPSSFENCSRLPLALPTAGTLELVARPSKSRSPILRCLLSRPKL